MMASLDHAMWFHRPFRADEWLLYDQDTPSASGGRGLGRGGIFTRGRRPRRLGGAGGPDPGDPRDEARVGRGAGRRWPLVAAAPRRRRRRRRRRPTTSTTTTTARRTDDDATTAPLAAGDARPRSTLAVEEVAELDEPIALAARPGLARPLHRREGRAGAPHRGRRAELGRRRRVDRRAADHAAARHLRRGHQRGRAGPARHGLLERRPPAVPRLHPAARRRHRRRRVRARRRRRGSTRTRRRELLVVEQPFANHNGGQLVVGPDGYLYIGLGDGGGGGDPDGHGQDPTTLLGTILRIDPEGGAEDGPAYAIPPGNPFADGEGGGPRSGSTGCATRGGSPSTARPATSGSPTSARTPTRRSTASPPTAASTPGRAPTSGGTRWRAPTPSTAARTRPAPCCPSSSTAATTGCSVTGGYVYRGEDIPGLQGTYLFADYCARRHPRPAGRRDTVIDTRTWDLPDRAGATPSARTTTASSTCCSPSGRRPQAPSRRRTDRGDLPPRHPGGVGRGPVDRRGDPAEPRDRGLRALQHGDQLDDTIARHFAGVDELVLLAPATTTALGDALRWEESRPGERFPHVYRRHPARRGRRGHPWLRRRLTPALSAEDARPTQPSERPPLDLGARGRRRPRPRPPARRGDRPARARRPGRRRPDLGRPGRSAPGARCWPPRGRSGRRPRRPAWSTRRPSAPTPLATRVARAWPPTGVGIDVDGRDPGRARGGRPPPRAPRSRSRRRAPESPARRGPPAPPARAASRGASPTRRPVPGRARSRRRRAGRRPGSSQAGCTHEVPTGALRAGPRPPGVEVGRAGRARSPAPPTGQAPRPRRRRRRRSRTRPVLERRLADRGRRPPARGRRRPARRRAPPPRPPRPAPAERSDAPCS